MKKPFLITLFTFFSASLWAQYDPKALEILEAMSKKYRVIPAFEASFSYTLTNDVEKINDEFKGKMTVKGDKYRLVLPEQEVINDGVTIWTYLPDAKEVTIDNFDPASEDLNPSKFYDIYKKGYKYLFIEEKTEAGAVVEVVDLVPEKKDAQYYKVKMFIVKKDKSIQSWTMYDKAGNRYKYLITKFTPAPKVDESFFTWDKKAHPGVEEVNLK